MSSSAVFERLDRIEREDPSPLEDHGVRDLMNSFATDPGQLQILIDRYAGTGCKNIAVNLGSVLLRKKFESGFDNTSDQTLSFISKLTIWDHPGLMVVLLNAIEVDVQFADAEPAGIAVALPLIIASVGWEKGNRWIVRSGSLDCLRAMLGKRWLVDSLAVTEKGRLRQALEGVLLEADDDAGNIETLIQRLQ